MKGPSKQSVTNHSYVTFEDGGYVNLHAASEARQTLYHHAVGVAREVVERLRVKAWQRHNEALLNSDRQEKTNEQLRRVGISEYGLHKHECKDLATILEPDEPILAAVNGRSLNNRSVLIVATPGRLIYISHIPMFTVVDELSYKVVGGVMCGYFGRWYATVTLQTNDANFTLRFVTVPAAEMFVHVIEDKSIEHGTQHLYATPATV